MPYVNVRDIEIYYELQGEGPRLLSISGSGGDLRRKPNVFDSPLASEFTILAYDQRGLGQTSIPDEPYTMQDYAEDADALLEAMGWDSCLVTGTSFGGMVGQEFAARFPQRIERLVLNCTSSGGAGRPSFPLNELLDLVPEQRFRRQLELSDVRRDAAWQAANPEHFQHLLDQSLEGAAIGSDNPDKAMGYRRQLEARLQLDVYDRLPSLSMPVMVCSGKYDGIAPPGNGRRVAAQIPNARYELFEGGHLFLFQDETAYPRLIAFLKGELDAEPASRQAAHA